MITTALESPSQELHRRERRYAVMALIFTGSFAASALLHDHTALALLLCGVAITTLVAAVLLANLRSPRRPGAGPRHMVDDRGHQRSVGAEEPPSQ